MTRTRRVLLAPAVVAISLGAFAPALAIDGHAILGVSTSRPVAVEARDLLGEWKDEAWRRVVWQVAPGERPGEFRATRRHKDGSQEAFRAVLIHARDGDGFLDLTPETSAAPEPSARHLFYKLGMERVDGLWIGTPRRVRNEFGNHPAKSYHKLHLLPARPAKLRDLLRDDPGAFPGPIQEDFGPDVYVIAAPSRVADFLATHGDDPSFWKDERDGTTVLRRRSEED